MQAGEGCDLLQVTSSALNNAPPGSAVIAYLTLLSRKLERRVGFLSNRIGDKVKRWVRPFTYDFLVYLGLWKPNPLDPYVWRDESRLLPLNEKKSKVLTRGHFVVLHLRSGILKKVEFRFGQHGSQATSVNLS